MFLNNIDPHATTGKVWSKLTKDGQKWYIFDLEPKILDISVHGLFSIYPCSFPVGVKIQSGLAKAGVSRLTLFRVTVVTRQWNYSGINKQSLNGT